MPLIRNSSFRDVISYFYGPISSANVHKIMLPLSSARIAAAMICLVFVLEKHGEKSEVVPANVAA